MQRLARLDLEGDVTEGGQGTDAGQARVPNEAAGFAVSVGDRVVGSGFVDQMRCVHIATLIIMCYVLGHEHHHLRVRLQGAGLARGEGVKEDDGAPLLGPLLGRGKEPEHGVELRVADATPCELCMHAVAAVGAGVGSWVIVWLGVCIH